MIALAFLFGRLFIQARILRKFNYDDALIILSWILFSITTSLYTSKSNEIYSINSILSRGYHRPLPSDLPQKLLVSIRVQWISALLFYFGLWSIKLSCLALFGRLGQNVRSQKQIWWTTLVITITSFLATIAISGWQCFLKASIAELQGYCTSPRVADFSLIAICLTTALDILTDLLLLSLPFLLLRKANISVQKKIGIGVLFSLTILMMPLSIARMLVAINAQSFPDYSLLTLWSSLEHMIAITIACLLSYRAWFTRHQQPNRLCDVVELARTDDGHTEAPQSQVLSKMKTSATIDVYTSRSLNVGVQHGGDACGNGSGVIHPPPALSHL